MANDAVPTQLPIMVRRPRSVWPGLDRMDLHRKQIAGDGNCLFASLADQLLGDPQNHLDVRAAVIDYMRAHRPLFESFAIKDDIQQKRATRSTTNAIKNVSEDTFEDYLSIMCKSGTYGGEPELMAFVQCYDRDVLVHLPRMEGYPEAIPYVNQHRDIEAKVKPQLHLCYGGDEVTFPHYDSVRRKTSISDDSVLVRHTKASSPTVSASVETFIHEKGMTARALRSSRSELSRDLMHDMITKASRDLRTSFDDADRARSPSVSSSHRSSSSKRSFDDDGGEGQRASKRADRRKSTRIRATFEQAALSQPRNTKLISAIQSQPATPQSTQSSDYSSDHSEHSNLEIESLQNTGDGPPATMPDILAESRPIHRVIPVTKARHPSEQILQNITAERRRSTLQT